MKKLLLSITLASLMSCSMMLPSFAFNEVTKNQINLELKVRDNNNSLTTYLNNFVKEEITEDNIYNLELMLRKKTFMNEIGLKKVQELSKDLSYEQKFLLYKKHQNNAAIGFLMNLFFPALSTLISGNFLGVAIIYGCDIAGITLFVNGLMPILPSDFDVMNPNQRVISEQTKYLSYIEMILGAILFFTGSIYNYTEPFITANNFNDRLRKALYFDQKEIVEFKENTNRLKNTLQVNIISVKF